MAGVIWYFQFFFYSMGQTKMGKYDFSSWTLHMASIIIFSTLWNLVLKEWHGTSMRTKLLVTCGLALLIGSTGGRHQSALIRTYSAVRSQVRKWHAPSPAPRSIVMVYSRWVIAACVAASLKSGARTPYSKTGSSPIQMRTRPGSKIAPL